MSLEPSSVRDLSHAILESLPGIYYVYNQERRFLRWNRRFEEVSEYTDAEIERLHPLDLFAETDRPQLAAKIESVFANGHDEVEAHFLSKSGRRTPYFFNGVRAEFNGQVCLLGMGIDVSAHKRAEESLRAADERMRLATRAANVGLWDWDLRSNEVYYSPEWKQQLGYQEHEIGTGVNEWQDRLHADDAQAALERLRAFLADPGLKYDVEFRLRHRDGQYRAILSQASLHFDEQGKPIRMLGSHVDVTDKRRLERQFLQAQKMEAVGQLAGGVAHDFNNLLTVINGYSDIVLRRLGADHPLAELLLQVHKAGERAGTLTRQLLAFSRQQVLEPVVLNLNAVVEDVEKMLRRLIGEDVALGTCLAPDLGSVKVDPGQIEQILINLAVNARDAMPTGGRLTITTRNVVVAAPRSPDVLPGDYVMLSLSDTGCGMDEATRARIFEPFFTTKPVGKGTGLGLATVHGIVQQSRGHIGVESAPGQGTTFDIYLPRVAERPSGFISPSKLRTMPRGSETLLLVEDEDAMRGLAKLILESCGYRVLEAANGLAALDVVRGHAGPIQLLVSDVIMPELGGRRLAEKVLELQPDCKVLFVSGYTDDAIVRHGVMQAEYAFLQKPFTPSVLAQKVRGVLDQGPAPSRQT